MISPHGSPSANSYFLLLENISSRWSLLLPGPNNPQDPWFVHQVPLREPRIQQACDRPFVRSLLILVYKIYFYINGYYLIITKERMTMPLITIFDDIFIYSDQAEQLIPS